MREYVYFLLLLLAPFLASPLRAEPATSLAGPSLSGAAPARAPLKARLEASDWWLTGELPGAAPTAAEPALHGRLAAGHRAAQRFCQADSWCEDMALTLTPVLRVALDAPAPQAGLGLLEELAWPLRPGLQLSAEGGLGDRVGLDLPLRPGGGPALMLKLSAGIGAELDRFGGPPLDLRLAVNAVAPIAGAEAPARPDDCSLQLQVAAKGGAPFHVSAPCGSRGRLGFGFRAAF